MIKNKHLDVKIFENFSAPTLELEIETFLINSPNIEITNMAYAVQKKEETNPSGYYSCILIYRRR